MKTIFLKLNILFMLFLSPLLWAEETWPLVKIDVSPPECFMGDSINIVLEVTLPTAMTLPLIDPTLWGDWIVRESRPKEIKEINNYKVHRYEWQVCIYKTGSFKLKKAFIDYMRGEEKLKTIVPPLSIMVKSRVKEGDSDIQGLRHLSRNSTKGSKWFWFIPLPIVLFLVLLFYFRRPKKKIEVKEIPLSPWEKAMKELSCLKALSLDDESLMKDFYFKLSLLFRHYIEDRFQVMAPERTTEEFIQMLKNLNLFDSSQKDMMRQFLKGSDLVKFAKALPSKSEAFNQVKIVEEFIQNTTPKEEIKETLM